MHGNNAEALMAEYSPQNPDPNAPQNPPNSVVNRDVRRTALRTYLLPIVALFAVIGLTLLYWSSRPPATERAANLPDREDANVAGTAGERNPDENSPGGHEPQRTPDSAREEVEHRGGHTVTELGDLLEENAHGEIGRRVEVADVDVDQVDSPTSFWVKDGNARVHVVAPAAGTEVRPGQQVDVVGVAERSGTTLRIRASRVTVSQ
jgi:hypothetical protein